MSKEDKNIKSKSQNQEMSNEASIKKDVNSSKAETVEATHIRGNTAKPSHSKTSDSAAQDLTTDKLEKLKQSLEALKKNPNALKAFQDQLGIAQGNKPTKNLPTTFSQKAVSVASKLTLRNLQKVIKGSVVAIDGFVDFVTKKEGKDRNIVVQKARYPILFGMWVCIIVFLIGGVWSGLAPLDQGSHAMGFVISDSKKQLIQHKEGGILEKVYVIEGEQVKTGQVLMQLSSKQVKSQLDGLVLQKESLDKQLALVKEQMDSVADLEKEGYFAKFKVMDMQTNEARILGQISDVQSRIIATEDSLDRLSIVSPINGSVNQIQVYTQGAAVPPGETLMTITPSNENLLIEAFVNPADIDSVSVGLKAKVKITAFKHRSAGFLEGTVSFVSSDVVEPPRSHQTQEGMVMQQQGLKYRVKIEIDKEQLKKISKYRAYELYPGMGADVIIVLGERTLLEYLLDPITSTFWHAFKET